MEKKNSRTSRTTKTITTRLPNHLYDKVNQHCIETNSGRSQFVKRCISFYLEESHKPKLVVKEEYPEPKGFFARKYFNFLKKKMDEKDARIKKLEKAITSPLS